ncbi:hypothetical protein ACFFJ8_04275, partial [Paenibacillus mendelii]
LSISVSEVGEVSKWIRGLYSFWVLQLVKVYEGPRIGSCNGRKGSNSCCTEWEAMAVRPFLGVTAGESVQAAVLQQQCMTEVGCSTTARC